VTNTVVPIICDYRSKIASNSFTGKVIHETSVPYWQSAVWTIGTLVSRRGRRVVRGWMTNFKATHWQRPHWGGVGSERKPQTRWANYRHRYSC